MYVMIVLVTLAVESTVAVAVLPYECLRYREIVEASRRVDYGGGVMQSDATLTPDWYRVVGAAGVRIHEESSVPYDWLPIDMEENPEGTPFCGRLPGGQVTSVDLLPSNSHPAVEEGVVKRRMVRYEYLRSFSPDGQRFSKLGRTDVQPANEVWIRNCGAYYVYYLKPFPLTYCTTNEPLPIDPEPKECKNHTQTMIVELDRDWNFAGSPAAMLTENSKVDKTKVLRFRANGEDTRLPEGCMWRARNVSQALCSTYYRSWLSGKYPLDLYKTVEAEICFSPPGSCECVWSFRTLVRNCGTYFVYETPANYRTNWYWRFCTERYITANQTKNETKSLVANTTYYPIEDMCSSYEIVIDDSRLVNSTSVQQRCEDKFYRSVRFISSDGRSLQMKENCSSTDTFYHRACGVTTALSFMMGRHPTVAEGAQLRTVCRRIFDPYTTLLTASRCGLCGKTIGAEIALSSVITVQNCGSFYVYKLEPFLETKYDCQARYCFEYQVGDQSAPTSTVPPTTRPLNNGNFRMKVTFALERVAFDQYDISADNPFLPDIRDKRTRIHQELKLVTEKWLLSRLNEVPDWQDKVVGVDIESFGWGSLAVSFVAEFSELKQLDLVKVQSEMNAQLSNKVLSDESGLHEVTGTVKLNSAQVADVNECLSSPCHPNANCTNEMFRFLCQCKSGFIGDGFKCVEMTPTTAPVLPSQPRNDKIVVKKELSDGGIVGIVIACVVGFVIIVLLLLLLIALCRSKKESSSAFQNVDSSYWKTKAPSGKGPSTDKDEMVLNSYVSVGAGNGVKADANYHPYFDIKDKSPNGNSTSSFNASL